MPPGSVSELRSLPPRSVSELRSRGFMIIRIIMIIAYSSVFWFRLLLLNCNKLRMPRARKKHVDLIMIYGAQNLKTN